MHAHTHAPTSRAARRRGHGRNPDSCWSGPSRTAGGSLEEEEEEEEKEEEEEEEMVDSEWGGTSHPMPEPLERNGDVTVVIHNSNVTVKRRAPVILCPSRSSSVTLSW